MISLPPRFQLDAEVGRGGMATVYRAHDQHLDRFVAIKVLSPEFSHAVGKERFQREIAMMAKLVHPGIVALFDSGEVDGHLYYVMPFVNGANLRARLLRERRLSPADAAPLGADIAEALAYAHGAGIVHRDVKPENIFSVDGRAVLSDFGIARSDRDTDRQLTTAGIVLGTLAYMSPEQATGESHIDGRSDLYSLGCVLYELVTGEPPYTAPNAFAMIGRHLTGSPQPPRDRVPGLAPAFDALILQLLSVDPSRRPASAGETARQLRAAVRSADDKHVTASAKEADRLARLALEEISRSAIAGTARRTHLEQAEVYLKRALAVDPRHARALANYASWHFVVMRHGYLPAEDAERRARELALEALAADDQCADVHLLLSRVTFYNDDDLHAALRHAERAHALDADGGETNRHLAICYKCAGRLDQATRFAWRSVELSPDIPRNWNGLGDVLLAAGRNAEAVDALRRALALQADGTPALERLELGYSRLGEHDMALMLRATRLRVLKKVERAEQLSRDGDTLGPAAALRSDWQRELAELLEKAATVNPFEPRYESHTLADQIITLHAWCGEWSKAMDWVEQGYRRQPTRLRRALTESLFDRRGLAVDPRYARLLRIAVLDDLL